MQKLKMPEVVSQTGIRIDLPITGMSCASCAAHIQESLSALAGVNSASVNFAAEKATVYYDKAVVSVDDFIKTIKEQGYGVSISRTMLPVKGMSCASCVANVQGALSALPGVVAASVNFATEKATVDYFPSQVGIRDFRNAIKDAGYELVETEKGEDIVEKEQRERESAYRSLKGKVITGAVLSVPIFILMQWNSLGLSRLIELSQQIIFFLQLILATPVQFWIGRQF